MAQIQITLTVPDDKRTELINALCKEYGYPEYVRNTQGELIPNPETKLQFIKRHVIGIFKEAWIKQRRLAEYAEVQAELDTELGSMVIE